MNRIVAMPDAELQADGIQQEARDAHQAFNGG
jgi:hypothetical protein